MKNFINRAGVAVFALAFVSLTLVAAPMAAHAADLDGGEDYGYSYGSSDDYGYSYGSPAYESAPEDYGYSYGSPADQDYGYSYGSTPSYSPYGYSTSGYSTGGYSTGGGYSYSTPVYHAPTPSYSNTNVNTNTCTNNSCNNDDHSVVNISNPAPIINNVVANYGGTQVQTQYCASGYSGTYPNCYINRTPVVYQQPIAYAATPYVSLSQVPYTGLDLGFWGTIAYWGAFVLFALVVAYLVAIKRVQNTIALKLKHFLFGTADESEEVVVTTSAPATVRQVAYATAAQSSEDVIDSFILSQVNRRRA